MTNIQKIEEIESLINHLESTSDHYPKRPIGELIEHLQTDCSNLDSVITRIYYYLEANIFTSLEFDQLKQKAKKVSEKLVETTEKLISLGSHRNIELEEFYKDIYFDLHKNNAYSHVIINNDQVSELKNYLKDSITTITIESKKQQPIYDPNLWDKSNFELFQHLYENYYISTKRQLTNIWFYLREHNYNSKKITKKNYKKFIFTTYNIEIKNFDKAGEKYKTEYITMDEHRINFQSKIKNT